MSRQIPVDEGARADEHTEHGVHEVAPDLAYQREAIVNVVFYGPAGAPDRGWVLIDAGIPGSGGRIRRAAERRFGKGVRPAAIIVTHGHFDHVGALRDLAEEWDAPIYAHSLEHQYLDGRSSYPPPDPKVGGGMMAAMAGLYPRGPIDVGPRLRALPADRSVPHMPGWQWIHTPGHTTGHVSLWQDVERCLIAGDAFITTRQESAFAVVMQKPELHGPPMYYTPDWESARDSVQRLAQLEPDSVVTGHGPAMKGSVMRDALHALANNFDQVAIPRHGRYVPEEMSSRESSD